MISAKKPRSRDDDEQERGRRLERNRKGEVEGKERGRKGQGKGTKRGN